MLAVDPSLPVDIASGPNGSSHTTLGSLLLTTASLPDGDVAAPLLATSELMPIPPNTLRCFRHAHPFGLAPRYLVACLLLLLAG